MKCKMKTFDLTTMEGTCPENCEYGAWNLGEKGICGAECQNCGGDLFLTENDTIYCTDCKEACENEEEE